jgi:hypothetical protein
LSVTLSVFATSSTTVNGTETCPRMLPAALNWSNDVTRNVSGPDVLTGALTLTTLVLAGVPVKAGLFATVVLEPFTTIETLFVDGLMYEGWRRLLVDPAAAGQ